MGIASANEDSAPVGGEKRFFRVSAYYSPLPNQTKYIRGSYEADILLNGRGTNGADGTEVYSGMLAAPSTYPFGTQIFLPGLGMGTVHDRGGAIVPAGQRNQKHDRIDVWMGSGDEGLARALQWGMRTVEGVVYFAEDASSSDTLDFTVIPQAKLTSSSSSSLPIMEKGAQGDSVKKLQKLLESLGYFDEEITGYYGEETESSVFAFQKQYGIVSQKSDPGAGVFGPQTRSQLLALSEKTPQQNTSLTAPFTRFLPAGMSLGSEGDTVEHLQRVLKNLGYYEGDVTGMFDENTQKAVYQFQYDYDIVSSESEYGSGVFGPKTQGKLFDLFAEQKKKLIHLSEKSEIESEIVYVPADSSYVAQMKEDSERAKNREYNSDSYISKSTVLTKDFPSTSTPQFGNLVAGFHSSQDEAISRDF